MNLHPYSAAASMAGYHWQIRQALKTLLDLDWGQSVELETDDDVLIRHASGACATTFQYKHSFSPEDLSLYSPELWKTLRVWLYLQGRGKIQDTTSLVLVTTNSVAPELNPLARPTATDAELMKIVADITATAMSAHNAQLERCYKAWQAASVADQTILIKRMCILQAEPNLSQADSDLDQRIRKFGVRNECVSRARQQLVGWFACAVDSRLTSNGCAVSYDELQAEVSAIHDDLAPASLQSSFADHPTPSLDDERADDPVYLRQLDLIGATDADLLSAVQMFHRGRKERNWWLQAKIAGTTALTQFDADLTNYWRMIASRYLRTPPQTDEAAKQCGLNIFDACADYRGAVQGRAIQVHVSVGSFHMLADAPPDSPSIGWHPHYTTHLAKKTGP